MRSKGFAGLAGALAMLAGCRSGPVSGHTTLVSSYAPLRAAFNADSGKVRAIFLASPT